MRTVIMLFGAATICINACGDSTQPRGIQVQSTNVTLDVVSGGDQVAAVGQTLAQPLVVKVVDKNLRIPVPGYLVNWVVTTGGGSMWVGATTTNFAGTTQNFWTLGPTPG